MATSTTSSINTSGISVGSDGKVKISGLSSGIDSQSIIDSLIKAKRVPAVNLESKITSNTSKIAAYGELKTTAATMTTALDKLRGNPGFQATNVFNTKTATGTTSAAAGAPSGYTPSSIDSLVVASIGNGAVNGNYEVQVQQLAKAQQIRSDVQAGKTTALNQSGSFSLNGQTITLTGTETLLDLRAKINSANAGVTATIVSASDTSNYLVLTSNDTGTAKAMNFAGGNSLTDALGLTDTAHPDSSGSVIKTQLQEAKDALLSVNGIGGIVRGSNEVSDLIEGVTLSLQKAEPNTVINLKVSTDLSAVKTALSDFVTSYNKIRDYVTDQRTAKDRNNDGTVADNEFGVLASDSVLRQLTDQLSSLASTTVDGNDDGYRSLSQLGITLGTDYKLTIDDTTLDKKLLTNVDQVKNLFALNVTTSDSRVTVSGRGASVAGGTYTLNVAGTDANSNITSANLNGAAGGADNGTVVASGSSLTASDRTTANGLQLIFSGGANAAGVNGIQIKVSRGIADLAYDFFNNLTKTTSGTLDTFVTDLQTQNTDLKDRVTTIDDRLTVTRAQLVQQYTAMETALAKIDNLKKTIQSYADSLNSSSG